MRGTGLKLVSQPFLGGVPLLTVASEWPDSPSLVAALGSLDSQRLLVSASLQGACLASQAQTQAWKSRVFRPWGTPLTNRPQEPVHKHSLLPGPGAGRQC